jgi:hypothetical protein
VHYGDTDTDEVNPSHSRMLLRADRCARGCCHPQVRKTQRVNRFCKTDCKTETTMRAKSLEATPGIEPGCTDLQSAVPVKDCH